MVRFKDGTFTTYEQSALGAFTINCIFRDREGTIWIGTSRGLHRLTKRLITGYSRADGLLHSEIYPILQTRNGDIWIVSIYGLTRFKDGVFHNTPLHGARKVVQALAEDYKGRLWIGVVNGLLVFENGKIKDLSSAVEDTTVSTILTDSEGNVWVGSGRVAVIDPEKVYINPVTPPVRIESVTLGRNAVDFQRGLTIQPGQRDLEISYTGLSFIKSDQIKFKYKLEGLDADWVDAGTRRVAYFPYLPPGTYTFQVIAANSDGVWNHAGVSFNLIVQAPFWRQSWFWLLCAVTIAAITALVFRHRLAQSLLIVKNWALIGLNSIATISVCRCPSQ